MIPQLLCGMEGRVVSVQTGEDLGPGEDGEILLRWGTWQGGETSPGVLT